MSIPREFTFYPFPSLGLENWRAAKFGQPGTAAAKVETILVKLTDDDPYLEDQSNAPGEIDTGLPQRLTAPVVSASGFIYGPTSGKPNVYALGEGTIVNVTTGKTGKYMVVGSTNETATSWGITSNIRISPNDQYILHTVNWAKNRLAYETINLPVCFTAGTLIETETGPIAIEALRAGDMILTYEGVFKPLRWIGSTKFSAERIKANKKLAPVVITAGALGNDLPQRDLRVSRQHRILISSPLVRKTASATSALIAAVKLTELPGIFIDEQAPSVEYFHMLFDRHEIVISEGTYSESLYLGAETLKSLSDEALEEIAMIFPDLMEKAAKPKSDYLIPSGLQQKKIISDHKNSAASFYAERP